MIPFLTENLLPLGSGAIPGKNIRSELDYEIFFFSDIRTLL